MNCAYSAADESDSARGAHRVLGPSRVSGASRARSTAFRRIAAWSAGLALAAALGCQGIHAKLKRHPTACTCVPDSVHCDDPESAANALEANLRADADAETLTQLAHLCLEAASSPCGHGLDRLRDAAVYSVFALAAGGDADCTSRAIAIHNAAVERLMRASQSQTSNDKHWTCVFGDLGIDVAGCHPLEPERLCDIHMACDYEVTGFHCHFRSDGVGVPLVPLRPNDTKHPIVPQDKYYPSHDQHRPAATAVLQPAGTPADWRVPAASGPARSLCLRSGRIWEPQIPASIRSHDAPSRAGPLFECHSRRVAGRLPARCAHRASGAVYAPAVPARQDSDRLRPRTVGPPVELHPDDQQIAKRLRVVAALPIVVLLVSVRRADHVVGRPAARSAARSDRDARSGRERSCPAKYGDRRPQLGRGRRQAADPVQRRRDVELVILRAARNAEGPTGNQGTVVRRTFLRAGAVYRADGLHGARLTAARRSPRRSFHG